MLLKTIATADTPGSVLLSAWYETDADGVEKRYEYRVTEVEYNDAACEMFAQIASEYYIHVTYVSDCESNTDAGNGYDDYSKEETDVDINLNDCIISNNTVVGFLCSAFDRQDVLLIEKGSVTISDPHNYSGRGYHRYRYKKFELLKRA